MLRIVVRCFAPIFTVLTISQNHLTPTELYLINLYARSSSLGLGEALLNDLVKEGAEEAEPFRLLDLAISIGIEADKELVDLGFTSGRIGIVGKANTLRGELLDFLSVDLTIAVKVKLVEGLLGRGESINSGGSDVSLIFRGKLIHLLCFFYL